MFDNSLIYNCDGTIFKIKENNKEDNKEKEYS